MEAEIAKLLGQEETKETGTTGSSSVGVLIVITIIILALFVGLYWFMTKEEKKKTVSTCRLNPCSGEGWSGDICTERVLCPRISDMNNIPFCPAGDRPIQLQEWSNGSDRSNNYGFAVSTEKACSATDSDCSVVSTAWKHGNDTAPKGTLSSSDLKIVLSDQADYNNISINNYIYVRNLGFRVLRKESNLTLTVDKPSFFPLNTRFTYMDYSNMKTALCKNPLETTGYAVSCPCSDCSNKWGKSKYHPIIMPADWDPTQAFCCPKIIERKKDGSCGECNEKNLGVVCVDNKAIKSMRQRICVNHGGKNKWLEYMPNTGIPHSSKECWGDMCSYGYFGNAASCPSMQMSKMRLASNKSYAKELKKQGRSGNTFKYARK